VDKNILDELAGKLADAVPAEVQGLRGDIEDNFRGLLQTGLDKLNLVTREEFDVQRKVLARTRAKLEQLETELEELQRDTVGKPDSGLSTDADPDNSSDNK
jgi:BMFP domain-containing protein YqiC